MLTESPLVLPKDVLIIEAAELAPGIRTSLGSLYDDHGAMVGRTRSRENAVFVDGSLLDLLREFEQPSTIVTAVIRYAGRTCQSAEQVLDGSYPALQRLLSTGLLVTDTDRAGSGPVYSAGAEVGPWRVLQCLQSYDDSGVYLLQDGSGGELLVGKVAHDPDDDALRRGLRHEAAALRLLGAAGVPVPRPVALRRDAESRPLLVMSHVAGQRVDRRAAQLRGEGQQHRLLNVCGATIRALARIHAAGLLHGDVHGGNYLLTEGNQAVVAVDFCYASSPARSGARHGVPRFMDPQWARSRLDGSTPPPASPQAEQYSMAALVCFLLTGSFPQGRTDTVADLLPRLARGELAEPFRHDADSLAAPVLDVLRRALQPEPADRWPDLAEFAAAFDRAAAVYRGSGRGAQRVFWPGRGEELAAYCSPDAVAARGLSPSAASGTAGTALALLGEAESCDDPTLLSWADLWAQKAVSDLRPDLSSRPAPEAARLRTANSGKRGGIWYGPAGPLAARVLVSHALGDAVTRDRALAGYLEEHGNALRGTPPADLTHGVAGLLLMDAHLLSAVPHAAKLQSAGDRAATVLAEALDRPAAQPGLAHGVCGHLHALLAWQGVTGCQAAGAAVVREHLSRISHALRGSSRLDSDLLGPWCRPGWEASWCNGATGIALMLLTAGATLSEPSHIQDAEAAIRLAMTAPPRGNDLCCGASGRVYALRRLASVTGERRWLRRARKDVPAERAALARLNPHGLPKGRAGSAAVLHDPCGDLLPAPLLDAPAVPAR